MDDVTENKQPPKAPWVPIAKDAAKLLPKGRPYTEMEALYSLSLNHNNDQSITVLGYSRLWGWGQGRVNRFLDRLGLEIQYPNDTSKVQKQPGKLAIRERRDQRRENGEITFIDFKQLEENAERKRRDQRRHITRSIEKEKKDKKKDPRIPVFIKWFSEKYRRAFDREFLIGIWGKAGTQVKALLALPLSWEDLQYLVIEFLLDDDPWLTGKGHHFGTLLMRINQNAYQKYLDPEFRENNRGHIISETGELLSDGNNGFFHPAKTHLEGHRQ